MDPPPSQQLLPDSLDSPRSYDDSQSYPSSSHLLQQIPNPKIRLMCSYGGHIIPRPHDKNLCYLGGDTRIIVVDRDAPCLHDLSYKLSRNLLNGSKNFILKYQLPNEDLDSLISVTTDEDLENMFDEYDRTIGSGGKSRLRLFLFPTKPETAASMGTLLGDGDKSESWFMDALNNAGLLPRGLSADAPGVSCLLGGGGSSGGGDGGDSDGGESIGGGNKEGGGGGNAGVVIGLPDMVDTNSSFGSSSSSPCMANLPPIRTHVEEPKVGGGGGGGGRGGGVVGLDECFAQMNMNAGGGLSGPVVKTNEMSSRILSDDERSERSDQGLPSGFRKLPPMPLMTVGQGQVQQKVGSGGGVDLPSPDGSKRDLSAIPRPKPVYYQESAQVSSRIDPNQIQMQQFQDTGGYIISSQPEQQQQQQQQQFVHAGARYIHHATGAVPMSSYYPMHPQQQLDQHFPPMFYVPVHQTQQPFHMSMQSNVSESVTTPSSRPPMHPNASMLASSAAYITRSAAPSQSQSPSPIPIQADQQYMGYPQQMHYSSQSIATPSPASPATNYPYEYSDLNYAQVYYTQPPQPQYQTMTSAAGLAAASESTQVPADTTKQQIRTLQPI